METKVVSTEYSAKSEIPRIALPPSEIQSDELSELRGVDRIINQIDILNQNPSKNDEEELHCLEREFVKENAELILSYAETASQHFGSTMEKARNGWDDLHHFRIESVRSFEEALIYRYIYVPLAYRLGYYTLAPKLAQMTFEMLLPKLESRVVNAVSQFLQYSEAETHALCHERFTSESPDISYCYSRPKTPHSIWKKVGSVAALENMNREEFLKRVDDYMMVVWIMKVKEGESRVDALENGKRIYERDRELIESTKRLTSNVDTGFPVIMAHAVWRGIPVEIQFLGGEILGWLTAMDYTKYKVGTTLDNIEERLTQSDWAHRGETMLRIYETSNLKEYEEGLRPEFHRILLDELLKRPVTYD